MVRRHLIAWAVSGTSVIGTFGAAVVTFAAPEVNRVAGPVASSVPPVTVYDDRYIDDLVAAPSPSMPTALLVGQGAVPPQNTPTTEATAMQPVAAAVPNPARPAPSAAPPRTDEPDRALAHDNSPATPLPTASPGSTPSTTAPRAGPAAPSSTTTVPAVLPPGAEVPNDWPTGTPYPPIPPGCRKPHLEDNGKWNCEH